MALIVHKYGGTSMGSTERIKNVAKRVAKWARAGHQMVVVPSAMSGETNRLLALAKELAPPKSTDAFNRELDALAATGEQASSALLAIALQAEAPSNRAVNDLHAGGFGFVNQAVHIAAREDLAEDHQDVTGTIARSLVYLA